MTPIAYMRRFRLLKSLARIARDNDHAVTLAVRAELARAYMWRALDQRDCNAATNP